MYGGDRCKIAFVKSTHRSLQVTSSTDLRPLTFNYFQDLAAVAYIITWEDVREINESLSESM